MNKVDLGVMAYGLTVSIIETLADKREISIEEAKGIYLSAANKLEELSKELKEPGIAKCAEVLRISVFPSVEKSKIN